jgi:hypothetical protein
MNGRNALYLLCCNYKNENLIDIIRLLIENGIELESKTFDYFASYYKKGNRDEILHLLGQHLKKMANTRPSE